MPDDVLHAAVIQQDALVLEAGVAAHRGPTPRCAALTVSTVLFGAVTVRTARSVVGVLLLCLLGQPGTAASWKRRAPRRLPEPLRPRLRLPVGYNTSVRRTAPRGKCWPARRRRSAAAFGAGLEAKYRREDSSERSRALPKPGGFAFPRPSRPAGRRIAQRTTWQNGSTAGSRRPKRRWEAATHRKRAPAQRKAAAERQPSATADR